MQRNSTRRRKPANTTATLGSISKNITTFPVAMTIRDFVDISSKNKPIKNINTMNTQKIEMWLQQANEIADKVHGILIESFNGDDKVIYCVEVSRW